MRIVSGHLKNVCVIALLGLPVLCLSDELSLDEIAKELSNPVTALATINNDFEYRIYQGSLPGADDDSAFIYTLRPSIPIPLHGNCPSWFV